MLDRYRPEWRSDPQKVDLRFADDDPAALKRSGRIDLIFSPAAADLLLSAGLCRVVDEKRKIFMQKDESISTLVKHLQEWQKEANENQKEDASDVSVIRKVQLEW